MLRWSNGGARSVGNASGQCLWNTGSSSVGIQYSHPYSVAVDHTGNVLVTGTLKGTHDFGCGPLTSAGEDDVFVAKLDPGGACLWAKRAGDSSIQEGTGWFTSSLDFGCSTPVTTDTGALFIAKLTSSGACVWLKSAPATYPKNVQAPPDAVEGKQRRRRYPQLADRALLGSVGSSAGGEHPKFLASRLPGPVPVLVKFSPPLENEVARRIGDLLVCEHIAHQVLARHGQQVPKSELLLAGNRVFLEVERFDRVGSSGRRGVLSLLALDAQLVGRMKSWSDSAAELTKMGVIPADALEATRWRELFGSLIGNTDMHPANLSFFASGTRVLGIAPCYDMLPMLYTPQHGHVVAPEFRPPTPGPEHAAFWDSASRAAADFWNQVADHAEVSDAFREIARKNHRAVDNWREVARRLPS